MAKRKINKNNKTAKVNKTAKINKTNHSLWILLGLLFPYVGIILYFIWKKNKKEISSKLLTSSIIGFCVYSLALLIIFGKVNDNIGEGTASEWYSDVTSGKEVVTVIGASFCSHCQEYKPIIKQLAGKYKFKLYFFEIDTLPEEDQKIIENTYELTDMTDNVPFTFLVKNNKYVTGTTGFSNKDNTVSYLKKIGVIKN